MGGEGRTGEEGDSGSKVKVGQYREEKCGRGVGVGGGGEG